MRHLTLVSSRERIKKGSPRHGRTFPIEKRAIIENGIPTIRKWRNGAPFLTEQEEDAVIAKFEQTIRKHWDQWSSVKKA